MGLAREFFSKFLFYHYHQLKTNEFLSFGRDYWVNDKVKRGSTRGELLAPENFMSWYLRRKDRGRCWVSLSYYATYVDSEFNLRREPIAFDRVVYDLDIPFAKEKVAELRERDYSLYREWFRLVKKEAYRLCYHLAKRYSAEPILIFTGNRGYQVQVLLAKPLEAKHYSYVWDILKAGFEETKIPEGLKEKTIKVLGENIEFEDIVDKNVRDPARLIRLPYTRHEKTKALSLVLDWKTFNVLKTCEAIKLLNSRLDISLIEKLLNINVNGEFARVKRAFHRRKRLRGGKDKYHLPSDPKIYLESDYCPPCIKAIWEKFKVRIEVSHLERLAILWFLMNKGYGEEEVINVFRLLPDFNEKRTRYQVAYAFKHKFMMFNCRTMRKKGIVSEELCKKCGHGKRGYKNPLSYRP